MPKNKHFRFLELSKKPISIPTHVPIEVAKHIEEQAYERGWSKSQYLRWLAMLDMKRCEDDKNLMSEVSGIPRERFDLYEQNELSERKEGKEKA